VEKLPVPILLVKSLLRIIVNMEETCEECFKIKCGQCGWEATDEDVTKIQCGKLTACPVCGWKPGDK